jgi:hypothetical protein
MCIDWAKEKREKITPQKNHTNQIFFMIFTWDQDGNTVKVKGSFDNWKLEHELVGTPKQFKTITEPGKVVLFKFIVDGQWMCNDKYETAIDNDGNINNSLIDPGIKNINSTNLINPDIDDKLDVFKVDEVKSGPSSNEVIKNVINTSDVEIIKNVEMSDKMMDAIVEMDKPVEIKISSDDKMMDAVVKPVGMKISEPSSDGKKVNNHSPVEITMPAISIDNKWADNMKQAVDIKIAEVSKNINNESVNIISKPCDDKLKNDENCFNHVKLIPKSSDVKITDKNDQVLNLNPVEIIPGPSNDKIHVENKVVDMRIHGSSSAGTLKAMDTNADRKINERKDLEVLAGKSFKPYP